MRFPAVLIRPGSLRRLALRRITLARELTEARMEKVATTLRFAERAPVLIAGSGRRAAGSESVLRGASRRVYADLSRNREPDVAADLSQSWPFGDSRFTAVVSTWVAEHVRDPRVFIRESARVLSPRGTLVAVVPFLYQKHGSPDDFFRFTDSAIRELVLAAGFRKLSIHPVGGGPFVCCVSLLWPFLRVPGLGVLLYAGSEGCDGLLRLVVKLSGRGGALVDAYPLSYICIAQK